jgi:hypothetical protein
MTFDHLVGVLALASYTYNTSGDKFVLDVYGKEHHPNYLAEKAEEYAESSARAISRLDNANLVKLARVAMERHGEHASLMATYMGREGLL